MTMTEDLNNTAIPLDTFRQVMGIDPWHFWQMRLVEGCSDVYTHYRWIGDGGPGRYDYAQALLMAETQLAQKLDYWPGLKYDSLEVVRMIKPRQPVIYNRTPMMLKTRWSHVQLPGQRTYTLLGNLAVVYTGADDVILTIAVPAGTVASEVVVCYAGTYVEIRPIVVSISANTATIRIKKWLMADPDLWETADIIDSTDTDNLLSTIDVYRVTYDTEIAILLAWEPELQHCGCLQEDCSICSHALHRACALRGDYKNGLIGWQVGEPGTSNWVSHPFPSTRYPDLAYVNYLHGWEPAPDRYMSPYWAQIVSHLSVALMDESACGCETVTNAMRYWAYDVSAVRENLSFTLGNTEIDNPFGARRGQIAAWRAVLMHIGD